MVNYQGQSLICKEQGEGIAEIVFDLQGKSINKFNSPTLQELKEVVDALRTDHQLKGLLLTSAKDCFIVGADITEFEGYFQQDDASFLHWIQAANAIFTQLEDLDLPSVTAINGFALGGGFELALATDYRIISSQAKVGLPETRLGIFPGWGGTTRLPRLIGADNAIEWIASGKQYSAKEAFKIGAVDAVVTSSRLREGALDLLQVAIKGALDWRVRRQKTQGPLRLNKIESGLVFEGSKAFVGGKAGPHYPAAVAAISAMQKGAMEHRDAALAIEHQYFCKIAKHPTASALVQIFLGDQVLKKQAKKLAKEAPKVTTAGILGAGIMGGGIAYQTACNGIPIYMKDIRESALEQGLDEAGTLLGKLRSQGRFSDKKVLQTINRIRPTLSYGDMSHADFVIEAVVEDLAVKATVLKEVEQTLQENTVLASNTSTIPISTLAKALDHPERFCGMHFFNPVYRMPLVEIIRGQQTSESCIATALGFALALGKNPIVVNDCPGFLINRILFPYFFGFIRLMQDGVDYQKIDQAMEDFGWPMGPAYLLDVVGLDIAYHAGKVMAKAYPDRMQPEGEHVIELLFKKGRLGQKSGAGFYRYILDKRGKPCKQVDPELEALLNKKGTKQKEMEAQEIVDRMMLPMITECIRCLQEDIVASPVEVDMGVIYGLGFPPFRGGVLRYADAIGWDTLCKKATIWSSLGELYQPSERMIALAQSGNTLYPTSPGKPA